MKLGDTIFNGNQFKNVILNSVSFKRLILEGNLVWSYFSIAIKSFKTRILADGGTYEGESILEDRLQEITPNLFDSASLVITPNGVKTSKLYTIKPNDGTGDLSVVRNTSATRIDENGNIVDVSANVAIIDYTTGSPAILVEPQRTNLLLRSEEFDNNYWGKDSGFVITQNVVISPMGTNTADRLDISATTGALYRSGTPVLSGNLYTSSIYIKAEGINIGKTISFELSPTLARQKIILTDKWQRITVTTTTTTTTTALNFVIRKLITDTATSFFIWGAQLEAGSNATSYIPTTTSSVTRNADVISKSGISNLIGQTEGTLYWEGRLQGQSFSDGVVRTLLSISDGTTNNRIEIYRANNLIYYDNIAGGAGQFSGPVFTITDFTGQPLKLAITYTLNNVNVFINGVLVHTRTTALIPACNKINIGSVRTGIYQWSGLIKGAVLLPLLTNTQAIQLTTL